MRTPSGPPATASTPRRWRWASAGRRGGRSRAAEGPAGVGAEAFATRGVLRPRSGGDADRQEAVELAASGGSVAGPRVVAAAADGGALGLQASLGQRGAGRSGLPHGEAAVGAGVGAGVGVGGAAD